MTFYSFTNTRERGERIPVKDVDSNPNPSLSPASLAIMQCMCSHPPTVELNPPPQLQAPRANYGSLQRRSSCPTAPPDFMDGKMHSNEYTRDDLDHDDSCGKTNTAQVPREIKPPPTKSYVSFYPPTLDEIQEFLDERNKGDNNINTNESKTERVRYTRRYATQSHSIANARKARKLVKHRFKRRRYRVRRTNWNNNYNRRSMSDNDSDGLRKKKKKKKKRKSRKKKQVKRYGAASVKTPRPRQRKMRYGGEDNNINETESRDDTVRRVEKPRSRGRRRRRNYNRRHW